MKIRFARGNFILKEFLSLAAITIASAAALVSLTTNLAFAADRKEIVVQDTREFPESITSTRTAPSSSAASARASSIAVPYQASKRL